MFFKIKEFRKKPKSILCATDVAARGISMDHKKTNFFIK